MSDQVREFVENIRKTQKVRLTGSVRVHQFGHDCAQVERDNLELHQALAEAIKRIAQHNETFHTVHWAGPSIRVRTADLLAVLKRTSKPDPKITDPLRGGFAT